VCSSSLGFAMLLASCPELGLLVAAGEDLRHLKPLVLHVFPVLYLYHCPRWRCDQAKAEALVLRPEHRLGVDLWWAPPGADGGQELTAMTPVRLTVQRT